MFMANEFTRLNTPAVCIKVNFILHKKVFFSILVEELIWWGNMERGTQILFIRDLARNFYIDTSNTCLEIVQKN